MPNQTVEFRDGMKFGHGYNRLTGDALASPAVTGETNPVHHAGGQQVLTDCLTIQDVESLHKALGVEVDAGGSYMGFSGSAKVDYTHQCDFSSFSMYVLVRVSVENAFESFDDPQFHPDAVELLRNNNPDRFRERFGDSYLSGIQTGGEYFAIYQLTSTDQQEKESLAVDVHAAFDGVLASAELNTHIKNATTSSRSHLEVRVHVFRQGAITTADLGVDDIMKTARAFPPAVAGDNGFPYSAQLSDYKGLKSPNDAFGYVDIQNQQDVMADLAKKRFQFLALRDDLAFVLKHSDDFENKDGSDVDHDALSHDFDEVVREINSMQLQLSQCSKDPGKCQFTDFDVSKFLVPRPRKKATGIDVVSLHGLRVWVIRKAALTPHLDLADYTAMVLAEMEPGEVGVIPSEAQYRFILSGVTFTFDRPVPPTAGVGAFRLWIAGQVPNAGDAGTGTPIAITTSTTRPA